MFKVGHFADLHSKEKDIEEVAKCAGFIAKRMEEEKPDLIVFAGDASHSRDIRMESRAARLIVETFSRLADVAPVVIVQGTASHDGNVPEILSMVHGFHEIHVSSKPEQIYLLRGHFLTEVYQPSDALKIEPSAVISLLPTPTKEWWSRGNGGSIAQSDMEISSALSAILAGFGGQAAQFRAPHLFVFHGTARGAKLCNGQNMIGREIEIGFDQIELTRCDRGLFGHIHLPQEVFPGVFYAGSVYAVDIGEAGSAHGFWMHELLDNGEWESVFHVTPTRKVSQVKADMTAEGYNLEAGLSDVDFAQASVRVEIKAWQDDAAQIDRAAIEQQFKDRGASEVEIRIIRVPRETVRSANIMKLHSLRDKIKELASTRGEEVAESILEKADTLEAGGVGQ